MSKRTDILVVGGSFTGLCAALAFQKKGYSVVLSSPGSSGLSVPNRVFALGSCALRFLENLGVRVPATPIKQVWASGAVAGLYIFETTGGVIKASVLYKALQKALTVDRCGKLLELSGTTLSETTARCEDGEVIAGVVVAADGKNSFCRRAVGIDILEWETGQTVVNVLATVSEPHKNIAQQYFLPTGPIAVLPLQGRHVGIVWTLASETLASTMLASTMLASTKKPTFNLRLKKLLSEHTQIESVESVETVELGCVLARRFVSGRVALVGDAAHTLHPLAGQGLTVAFKDIAVLADCLEKGRALGLGVGHIDLQSYERARRWEATGLSLGFAALDTVFKSPLRSLASVGLGFAKEDFLARCAKRGGFTEWPKMGRV